ncbi:coiled-coil domain-containing protein-domain-containing protein [Sordaria brevicollis]|uniref:Coiled-coil domain-containing protein-domain-containing protein n=1 Tax=Sordaria brevicollis TaxID=83679 RepID=A0AAE0PA28_SORBR|nr:coiled-coil domain-containing protein-domain-containing protein [Sordaria brevicollis]
MSPRFDSPPPGLGSARHAAETADIDDDDSLFSKPRPRPARSSAEKQEIRTRNRRREYLERNPGYFQSGEHELADPILYDSLIRRFQTPAERQAESKEKGYARVLEGSLLRGEEKLARLAAATATGGGPKSGSGSGEGEELSTSTMMMEEEITTTVTPSIQTKTIQTLDEPTATTTSSASTTMFATFTSPAQQPLPHLGGGFNFGEPSSSSTQTARSVAPPPTSTTMTTATALALTGTDIPAQTREEGQEQWHAFLSERFVRGGDEDFDYAGLVDNDDELDTLERREQEEAWFDEEEPDWASDGDEEGGGKVERVLEGETGVQDF